MSYTHLDRQERYQIQRLRRGGLSLRDIGRIMDRHTSTIQRELARNALEDGDYDYKQAHRESVTRRHAASSRAHIDPVAWEWVEARLREDWSPEQIAGAPPIRISIERIYQHVATDRQRGGTLWKHLRCRKRRRHHRCGTPRERQRFRGKRIGERPSGVSKRWRVGDWEGDTMVGKGLARLVTLVERKSGLVRIRRVANGEATTVMRAVIEALHPLSQRVHTLTWGNGSEFAEHEVMDIALEANSYFADPYSSWQRGCNENCNGLIRQYCPKGCDLSTFTGEEIQRIEDKLNRRPRKRLDFQTPQDVFDQSFKRVALQS